MRHCSPLLRSCLVAFSPENRYPLFRKMLLTSPMSYHDLIRAAQARIAGHVRRTPVIHVDARPFGLALAHPLALKLELLQHTGSFKPRGAFNNLLSRKVPAAGVVAASGGNHGAAVAFASMKLKVPAKIFIPSASSPAKIA